MLQFAERLHITGEKKANYLDITHNGINYHPNWMKLPTHRIRQQKIDYCNKDDPNPETFNMPVFTSAKNFRAKMYDHMAFAAYKRSKHQQIQEIKWPIQSPNLGISNDNPEFQFINDPEIYKAKHPLQEYQKRRHYLITGPANTGKSLWLKQTFRNVGAFYVGNSECRWENYDGQQIIIYDDVGAKVVTRDEIIAICDVHTWDYQVPLKTRYMQLMMKANQARIVFFVCNETHLPDCFAGNDDAIEKRFNRWRLKIVYDEPPE